MAALARAYAGDPAKPVWLQEFGATPHWMDAALIPRFLEASVEAAIVGGISWITWWCSHDVMPKFQFDPIEYDLGLITTDNQIKPTGEMFRSLARAYPGKPVTLIQLPTQSIPKHDPESTWRWLEKMQQLLPNLLN